MNDEEMKLVMQLLEQEMERSKDIVRSAVDKIKPEHQNADYMLKVVAKMITEMQPVDVYIYLGAALFVMAEDKANAVEKSTS